MTFAYKRPRPTATVDWNGREVEISYTYDGGDSSVGVNDGAGDTCVESVDGEKDPALLAAAQEWFDADDKAQQEVHEIARDWADNDDIGYF